MEVNYKEKALKARQEVLSMVYRAQTSHIASNLSVIDIATVLYENLKPEDEVVWSKGWAAATIYYFLAQQGKIPQEDLEKFPNPPYLGLAETTVPGVLCNGGAVGHGTPIATGIALGKKRAGIPGTVYCIMSDGELNEGSVWESAMMAAHHKLDNLVFIVDQNEWQAMGKTADILNIPFRDVFKAIGWDTWKIDGHSVDDIEHALICAYLHTDVEKLLPNIPAIIFCKTVKGKGVSFMENTLTFHYRHLDEETYQRAMAELV